MKYLIVGVSLAFIVAITPFKRDKRSTLFQKQDELIKAKEAELYKRIAYCSTLSVNIKKTSKELDSLIVENETSMKVLFKNTKFDTVKTKRNFFDFLISKSKK